MKTLLEIEFYLALKGIVNAHAIKYMDFGEAKMLHNRLVEYFQKEK